MVTLVAAPQAIVTATRGMSGYCITQFNTGTFMKVPNVSRCEPRRMRVSPSPFASRKITSL